MASHLLLGLGKCAHTTNVYFYRLGGIPAYLSIFHSVLFLRYIYQQQISPTSFLQQTIGADNKYRRQSSCVKFRLHVTSMSPFLWAALLMCKQHHKRARDPFLNGTKTVNLMVCVNKVQKVRLHLTSPYPSPSKFNIVQMVTSALMGRLGVQPIQSITHKHNVKLSW